MLVKFFISFCFIYSCLSSPVLNARSNNITEVSSSSASNIEASSNGKLFSPKVFIVSLFELERDPWLKSYNFTNNVTIPGLSPVYPSIHCDSNYTICQVTLGEGEINAAISITSLTLNPIFDLSSTYFIVAGIAGGVPEYTTLGSVTISKYAVQVGLEYQFAYEDYHNVKPNWKSGYIPYGTTNQTTYPNTVYGSEVFELNEKLRDQAFKLASKVKLNNGNELNKKFRKLYNETAARSNPKVVKCDVLTSDNYFTGPVLNDYFNSFTNLLTNGSAKYCATAQEDNAILETFTRLDKYEIVDYERVIVMRSISDFSTNPPSMNAVDYFFNRKDGGIQASLDNLVIAGKPIITDIVKNWDKQYKNNKYSADNYVGDIFGTVGGKPDFGKDSFEIA
ncbi:unnamed protein product [Candida verbasci]|uniref:Purine nucleoside permease n=1 Tax=Candida verbasci TaxID=1227364 RepID=A0A9W4U0Z6_9ASCO|nr:unnamed protein product [Candida verbasci]